LPLVNDILTLKAWLVLFSHFIPLSHVDVTLKMKNNWSFDGWLDKKYYGGMLAFIYNKNWYPFIL